MKQKFILIGGLFITCFLIIFFLNRNSSRYIHLKNPFIRVFPPHPYSKWSTLEFPKGYQLVGQSSKKVYLCQKGNFTNYMTVDLKSLNKSFYNLKLPKSEKFAWSAANIKIDSSGIYLYEGLTPKMFHSKLNANYFRSIPMDSLGFIQGYLISPQAFISISYDSIKQQNILNLQKLDTFSKIIPKPSLLTKQLDGVFCTLGKILTDPISNKVIYLYHYRNEYLTMDTELNLLKRANTIDTISKVQIQVGHYKKGAQMHYTFSAPPLMVNKSAAVYDNILYIYSNLKAKNENEDTFSEYNVIDVYALQDFTYRYSFYLPKLKGESIQTFIVQDQILVAQYANHLGMFYLTLPKLN
tara:strand:+ start:8459 stop:9520 length:1062 start_codon:yes stop_codon:yes gene_type:complete